MITITLWPVGGEVDVLVVGAVVVGVGVQVFFP
jgi:hypothetical protein